MWIATNVVLKRTAEAAAAKLSKAAVHAQQRDCRRRRPADATAAAAAPLTPPPTMTSWRPSTAALLAIAAIQRSDVRSFASTYVRSFVLSDLTQYEDD